MVFFVLTLCPLFFSHLQVRPFIHPGAQLSSVEAVNHRTPYQTLGQKTALCWESDGIGIARAHANLETNMDRVLSPVPLLWSFILNECE